MDMSEIFVKNGEAFGMGSQKQDLRYGLFSSPLIHFCSSLVLEFCGRCIKPLTNIDRIPSHLSRQAVFPRKRAELHPVNPGNLKTGFAPGWIPCEIQGL